MELTMSVKRIQKYIYLKKQDVGHCLIHGWMITGVNARHVPSCSCVSLPFNVATE
jgi:hypothetical protein